ncbi:MAG: hydrogenase maturation protease [Meiothermus sp.]|nr:hydrogenase maturation protease [Meiothermus sp.]
MSPEVPLPKRPEILIVGCGNLLRSDDAVGPVLIRRLWQLGLPDHIEVVDGGTAGMDVAFKMEGRKEVVIVDACVSGAEPGTLYEVPGHELEDLPLQQANLHGFRWDNAIAFGRWLLKDRYPQKVTVFLIEGEHFSFGMDISPRVAVAMDTLAKELLRRFNLEGATAVPMDGIRVKSLEGLGLSDEP